MMCKSTAGFTLIEMLIYIGLLTVLIMTALMATNGIRDTYDGIETAVEYDNELLFLTQKISWTLADMSAVDFPTENGFANSFTVERLDSEKGGQSGAEKISITLDSGKLFIDDSDNNAGSICLGCDVTVSQFEVNHFSAGADHPEGIMVTMLINDLPYTFTSYVWP